MLFRGFASVMCTSQFLKDSVPAKLLRCKRFIVFRVDDFHDKWYIIPMEQSGVVTTRQQLEQVLTLDASERRWFDANSDSLPLSISRYYLSLIDPDDPDDPLRKQVVPTIGEQYSEGKDDMDPLAEAAHSVFPRFVHRYRNRAAFLVTDRCATYCRHCFRRRFTATECTSVSDRELEDIASYLAEHAEIKELLLTGGDPLMVSDEKLAGIIGRIRKARPDLVLRLCTRMPVTLPARVTKQLVTILANFRKPAIFIMTQFNHWREITNESRDAVARFVDAGFPVMNQTVLLRKVNDDVDTLERLMNDLVSMGVKPYYLFQGDLVAGTSHLRVPLERGLELEGQLRQRLSGLAMPTYAIDLPGGGGKVPLGGSYLKGRSTDGDWVFSTLSGEKRIYPDPRN
jgi:lysine 2,3-aminomutase